MKQLKVSRAGFGNPGYCRICAWEGASELNKHIAKEDWNAGQAKRWAQDFGFTFDRGTYYKHKPHITDPKRSFVDQARLSPVRRVNAEVFLEAVKDAAFANIDPEQGGDPRSVTLDQGLKAAQTLQASRQAKRQPDALVVLARLVTGKAPEIVAAAFHQLTTEEEIPNGE